jgi:hypothetical protein
MEMNGERSLSFGIGLQLHARCSRNSVNIHVLRTVNCTFLFANAHGAIAIKNHAFGDNEAGSRDVADQPRRREQLHSFFCGNVSFHLTPDDHDLAGDLGAHFGPITDGQWPLTLDFPFHNTIDSGRSLKTQLSADTASFVKITDQPCSRRLRRRFRFRERFRFRSHSDGSRLGLWIRSLRHLYYGLYFRALFSTRVSIKPSHVLSPCLSKISYNIRQPYCQNGWHQIASNYLLRKFRKFRHFALTVPRLKINL